MSGIGEKVLPYIDRCVVCSVEKGVQDGLCEKCAAKMKELEHGGDSINGYTARCAYEYKDDVGKLVRRFKYNDARYLSQFMAQKMANSLGTEFSFVTNVPLHKKRRKHRGYDQAELLAKQVAEQSGLPYVSALERTRNTKTQTKLDAKQRQENMDGAFECTAKISGRALLVDDVLTTGATAVECARVLKKSGAQEVVILTFARATGEKTLKRRWSLKKFFAIL